MKEPRRLLDRVARQKLVHLTIVLMGLVAGQFLLYGPSLSGQKVLLPLDILAQANFYIPNRVENPNSYAHDPIRSDLMLQFEPDRRFAASELKQGRFPFWTPGQYGGVPFIWPKYSPFFSLTCLTESPGLIAWAQLLEALVAGLGAGYFARCVLRVGFWPATLIAWCYPMTGFFILWQGYPTCAAVYWLPWLLAATDRTARLKKFGAPTVAVVTGLVLVSGHIDVAAQTLFVAGLYAFWCLWDEYRQKLFGHAGGKAALFLLAGWGLGLALGAPQVIPVLEYSQSGERMEERAMGLEERPPVGIMALPQVVLPDMYGATMEGSPPLFPKGESYLPETTSAAYAGLLATLVAAPLAWFSWRHRSAVIFWTVLALAGLSWCLNVPGLVQLLRLPGLKLMSHNRLVFATSFAILVLAAIGLEALFTSIVRWRRALWIPVAVLCVLCFWCIHRIEVLPEPLATQFERSVAAGRPVGWMQNPRQVWQAQDWFSRHYQVPGLLCGAGLLVLGMLRLGRVRQSLLAAAMGVLLLVDLLWFSHGRSEQCDPALYFPRVPALSELSNAAPGRVIGYDCLPAKLAETTGLRDVRGYDSIDPGRWVRLLRIAADPRSAVIPHALTQWLIPQISGMRTNGYVVLSPVLDLLGVTHVIFRGTPPPGIRPVFQSPDYWVMENSSALSRVFVPKRVKAGDNDAKTIQKLADPEFDPRQVAYVEASADLPCDCRGTAEIVSEIPSRIVVQARMDTAGLLVLADFWDKGWRAYIDHRAVPILRTDYALRGVLLPAGSAVVEFRYEPASVILSFWLAGAAAMTILGWLGLGFWLKRKADSSPSTSVPTP
jgi:hypothetical protein